MRGSADTSSGMPPRWAGTAQLIIFDVGLGRTAGFFLGGREDLRIPFEKALASQRGGTGLLRESAGCHGWHLPLRFPLIGRPEPGGESGRRALSAGTTTRSRRRMRPSPPRWFDPRRGAEADRRYQAGCADEGFRPVRRLDRVASVSLQSWWPWPSCWRLPGQRPES